MKLLRFIVLLPLRILVRSMVLTALALAALVARELLPREQRALLDAAVVHPLANFVESRVAAFTHDGVGEIHVGPPRVMSDLRDSPATVASPDGDEPRLRLREATAVGAPAYPLRTDDPALRHYFESRDRLRAVLDLPGGSSSGGRQ